MTIIYFDNAIVDVSSQRWLKASILNKSIKKLKTFYSNFKEMTPNLKFNPFKLGVVFYIVRLIKRIMARMAITNADRIPAIFKPFLLLRFWIFIFHHFKQLAFNFKIECGLLFAIIANAIIVIFVNLSF